jgi:hypothetical protein
MAGWALVWYILLGIWALLPRKRRGMFGDAHPLRAMGS